MLNANGVEGRMPQQNSDKIRHLKVGYSINIRIWTASHSDLQVKKKVVTHKPTHVGEQAARRKNT